MRLWIYRACLLPGQIRKHRNHLFPSKSATAAPTESCLDHFSLEKLRLQRYTDGRSLSESPGECKSQFLSHGLLEVIKGKYLENEDIYDMLIKYADD